ncbi:hypothetical protein CYMTET_41234 [Cymbomonas tetramitiformis]|uniref:Uncharacterized protein n=1 Tax=Cymbomonas tetramitiformis TaxID=36881 RepID=A0AAE0C7J6_9CHLO|nr:hypothetical protein CYMTET_41234 [Cymbomonas tetramitiformis]
MVGSPREERTLTPAAPAATFRDYLREFHGHGGNAQAAPCPGPEPLADPTSADPPAGVTSVVGGAHAGRPSADSLAGVTSVAGGVHAKHPNALPPTGVTSVAGGLRVDRPNAGLSVVVAGVAPAMEATAGSGGGHLSVQLPDKGVIAVDLMAEGMEETHTEQPGVAAQTMVVPADAEVQVGQPGGRGGAGANSGEVTLQQTTSKGNVARERETVSSRQPARLRWQSLETVVVLGFGEGPPSDHTPRTNSSALNPTVDVRRVSCRERRLVTLAEWY